MYSYNDVTLTHKQVKMDGCVISIVGTDALEQNKYKAHCLPQGRISSTCAISVLWNMFS